MTEEGAGVILAVLFPQLLPKVLFASLTRETLEYRQCSRKIRPQGTRPRSILPTHVALGPGLLPFPFPWLWLFLRSSVVISRLGAAAR